MRLQQVLGGDAISMIPIDDGSEDELIWKFLTFATYARSWAEQIRLEQWNRFFSQSDEELIRSRLGGRKAVDYLADQKVAAAVRKNYARGMVTAYALEISKPIGAVSRVVESIQAPTHAYYAIHGVGTALVIALSGNQPKSHGIFKRIFTEQVAIALPPPFDAICEIGNTARDHKFRSLDVEPEAVRRISHTSFTTANSKLLVAKSLVTTRDEMIERVKASRRASLKVKRLNASEVDRCHARVGRVGLIDFLYRMRIRSNYGDPYVYLTASDMEQMAEGFTEALYEVTESLLSALRLALRFTIGKEKYELLDNSLPSGLTNRTSGYLQLS